MILEDKRSINIGHNGSYFTMLNKQWAIANNLKQHKVLGNKFKVLSTASVAVIVAPDSPLYKGEALERFKKEMQNW